MQQNSQQEFEQDPKKDQKKEPQQWFTLEEAAEYLRISRHTIQNYIKQGILSYYILPLARKQPRKRFKREDLDDLLFRAEKRKEENIKQDK